MTGERGSAPPPPAATTSTPAAPASTRAPAPVAAPWRACVEEVEKESPRFAAALKEAALLEMREGAVAIQLPPGLHAETVERRRADIEAVLARVLGRPTCLEVKVGAPQPAAASVAAPASIAHAEAADRQARSAAVREAAKENANIREAARILDGRIDDVEEL